MKVPSTTYRIQFSSEFTFEDFGKIIDYLDEFGISTIYASPFFQAREGSTHGYDVVDPFTINKEIGSLKDFRTISDLLKQKKMDWLQDIVPNHMAFDAANPWIRDIVELGPKSEYYHFYDINWDYKNWQKLMAPFLGSSLEEVIENAEIELKYDQNGFSINYFEHSYPTSYRSYSKILGDLELGKWNGKFKHFSGNELEWEDLKMAFFRDVQEDLELKKSVEKVVGKINSSKNELREILALQFFLPVHWKQTEKEINYRRFFTINDLICLRMEDRKVFESYHYFIKELCEQGLINGLRIDHIDGLFDPSGYLGKLRELVGDEIFILVEKILEAEEKLPAEWPIQGTSGYDFLAQLNQLLTNTENEDQFTEAYMNIFPEMPKYEVLVHQKKLFILKERMGGELHNLCLLLKEFKSLNIQKEEEQNWKEAVCAFLAGFPVYRIYPQEFPLEPSEKSIIETAFSTALVFLPAQKEKLEHIKEIFFGEAGADHQKMLFFLQRCQQYSGPLAAKGVEDTSFYIYNRLIAHNEVGDSPHHFGISVKEFHRKILERKNNFPYSMNATATHDTKRGEDARARLLVLSEIPGEWFQKVEDWMRINQKIRRNKGVPSANEEYLIYQALLAAMPFEKDDKEFLERSRNYLQKALREAKVNTNWSEPDEVYEKNVFQFVEKLLNSKEFRSSFDPFLKKTAHYGIIKSLGQCLLKCTIPGIPDIYQGTELWDFSYVDPDNRREVDYDLRKRYLSEFKGFGDNRRQQIAELLKNYTNGQLKMYSLHKILRERRDHPDLFEDGEYLPLEISGGFSEEIIAYARKGNGKWALIIVPILVTNLFNSEEIFLEQEKLKDVVVSLPEGAPKDWLNIFTGEHLHMDKTFALINLLKDFPIACLKNEKS